MTSMRHARIVSTARDDRVFDFVCRALRTIESYFTNLCSRDAMNHHCTRPSCRRAFPSASTRITRPRSSPIAGSPLTAAAATTNARKRNVSTIRRDHFSTVTDTFFDDETMDCSTLETDNGTKD